jgi:hypothetical protein
MRIADPSRFGLVGALLVDDPPREDCAPAWQAVRIKSAPGWRQFNRGIFQVGKLRPYAPQKSRRCANLSQRASAKRPPFQT